MDDKNENTPGIAGINSADSNGQGPTEQYRPINNYQFQPEPSRPSKRRFLKIIGVLVFLAGIAAGALYLWQRSQPVEMENQASIVDVDTLRIGTVGGPANHIFPDPETTGISFNQSRQIYEGLVGSKDKKFVPLLADSWTNPDQRTWLFKLKPDVTFHTGKALTAKEVKASLDALKNIDYWSLFVETIQSVEIINDYEIKLVTKEPDPLLLNRLSLAFIFDTEATDKVGANGTGAYVLEASDGYGEKFAALTANENYHQGKPMTKRLEYIIYGSEAEVANAQLKGDIDYSETVINPENKKLSDAGFASETFESPGVFGMYLNIDRPNSPLKIKEVRQAIALAVDRAALVKEMANGTKPVTQVIPKSLPGYDASVMFPDHDPEAARQALRQAFPAGLSLEYAYFEGVQPDAPILIKQLRAAGFTIVEKPETNPEVLTQRLTNGDFDLFSGAFTSDLMDSRDLLGTLIGKDGVYPTYRNDEKYEQLLSASDLEFDPAERIAVLQQASKYITDNLLWIPLRNTAYVAFYDNDLHLPIDYEGGSNLGVYYWRVGRKVQQ